MSIISEKFNAKITSLKEEFQINKDVVHQGIKGGLNEVEFSNLVSEIIPKKFKISKGIIENIEGEQSNETDFFIYDDEILPPYIKNDLAFVPVEATKYVFEIKSILNSTELKTTISKFSKYADLGGRAPTVLFSFSTDIQGSELDRYRKNDANFYTYPELMVLCVSDKGYYYKMVEEKYLIEILPIEEFIKNVKKEEDFKLKVGDTTISFDNLKQTNLTINSDSLKLNGIDYSKIKYKIHRWFGVENAGNIIELSLLSGISNTLCKEKFGKYLLHGKDPVFKVFSICFEDMWGNISCQDFDPNGLSYNLTDIEFTFSSNKENHKLLFNLKSN
ncbi:DUF6602 domain-containing protein [Acinetobacter sp. ULE_I001]|uniref:DUF6602 domain-containing protein n=1 Tax=unclassified Acinetobacter TaxID=196816 RepID=UPI003AF5CA3C